MEVRGMSEEFLHQGKAHQAAVHWACEVANYLVHVYGECSDGKRWPQQNLLWGSGLVLYLRGLCG